MERLGDAERKWRTFSIPHFQFFIFKFCAASRSIAARLMSRTCGAPVSMAGRMRCSSVYSFCGSMPDSMPICRPTSTSEMHWMASAVSIR